MCEQACCPVPICQELIKIQKKVRWCVAQYLYMPETNKIQKQAPRIKERNHRGASERILYLIRSLDVNRRVNGFLYASTTLESTT